MTKTLLSLLAIFLSACASAPQPAPMTTPDRQPAGFEKLGDIKTGPSLLYQGPFLVGEDGPKREPAKVFLPVQYDSQAQWPLVVLLHGFTATGDIEDFYLGLSARVSLRGFILVTPNGIRTPKGIKGKEGRVLDDLPFWNATDTCCDFGDTKVDDSGYLTRVISEVRDKYHVDSKRIYLFGHSNGGFMVNRMACEIGDQLSAVASFAGGSYKEELKCLKPTALPYLQIHAVDDETILYGDAPEYAGAKGTIQQWLKRNSCTGLPKDGPWNDFLALIPHKDTTTQIWDRCASQKPVQLWTIKAHKHALHNPHLPLFNLNFTDRVLDFLFAH